MIQITSRPLQEIIIRGSGKVEVLTKPRADQIKVVQTVSPVPTSGSDPVVSDLASIYRLHTA